MHSYEVYSPCTRNRDEHPTLTYNNLSGANLFARFQEIPYSGGCIVDASVLKYVTLSNEYIPWCSIVVIL